LDQIAVIALKCPNCGGRLEISSQMSNFACAYCGASVMVQRRGGTVSLSLSEAIERVQAGTDKTAAELALRRLKGELSEADAEITATERSISAGVAEREAAIAKRLKGETDRNFTSVVFVVAWIVFTLIARAFKSFQDSAVGIGFVLACLVAFPVWFILVKGRAVQVQRLSRQLEEARRKGKEDLARLIARVEDIKARIAKSRSIVDA
jgi:DNA-directed RNA polymerase subunit RPC12/RpoP